MRNKIKFFLIFLTLIIFSKPMAFSLNLEVTGSLGSLAIDTGRLSNLSSTDETFSPQFLPFGQIHLWNSDDRIGFNTGVLIDPILRNRLYGNFTAEFENIFIETGVFINLLGSNTLLLNPGVTANLIFRIPGIIFAEAGASSTLAYFYSESEGSHAQYSGNVSLGFWVPYVICSFNMSLQNFTIRETEHFMITDELERIYFRADVFTKNVPYTINVDFGYQSYRRSYINRSVSGSDIITETETDELRSLFAGIEGRFNLNYTTTLIIGLEVPLHSWSTEPAINPPRESLFFKATLGAVFRFL